MMTSLHAVSAEITVEVAHSRWLASSSGRRQHPPPTGCRYGGADRRHRLPPHAVAHFDL